MAVLMQHLALDESGQGLVEYALLLFLIAFALFTGLTLMGRGINDFYSCLNINQYL